MKRVTLTNSFHGTSVAVWLPRPMSGCSFADLQASGLVSARTLAKIRRALCGVKGCCCGVLR